MSNKVLFAFGKASETKESAGFKKYYGIGTVNIVAVNPTKEELTKIYGVERNAPEYIGVQNVDGKQVPYSLISFIVKTIPDKNNGIEMLSNISFFIRNSFMKSNDNKVKVIDKYARTAWVTEEEFKTKSVPMYKNGPAPIDSDYRPIYNGEENLIKFVKMFLNIPRVDEWKDGKWVMKANPEQYQAGFNEIEKWFKGDVSEVKNAINLMPNNAIKVLFGIKTNDDGKEFIVTFNREFMPMYSNYTKTLAKAVDEATSNGAYPNVVFTMDDLKEYSPTPTELPSNIGTVPPSPFDDDLPDTTNPFGV